MLLRSAVGLCCLLLTVACSSQPSSTVASKIEQSQRSLPSNNRCIESVIRSEQVTADCLFGRSRSAADADFAVIGDSHAMILMDAVETLSRERDLSGVNLTMSACPPFESAVREPSRARDARCHQFRDIIFAAARSGELPKNIIVHARWGIHFNPTPFDNGEGGIEPEMYRVFQTPGMETLGHEQALLTTLESFLLELIDLDYNVLFVHSVPEMGWHVPEKLTTIYRREGTLHALSASVSLSSYFARNELIFEAASRWSEQHPEQFREVFPHHYFCDVQQARCFGHLGGSPLYYDDDHVAAVGAYLLVQELDIFNE